MNVINVYILATIIDVLNNLYSTILFVILNKLSKQSFI